jgi:hypothetical protein
MVRARSPSIDQVKPDTPLRLSVAAAMAFPDGSMTASGLRREKARGRLIVERIAGKDYTTLADIKRMRELCRDVPEDLDCGSGRLGMTPSAGSPTPPPGSSSMDQASSVLDAMLTIAEGRSRRSADISTPGISPQPLPARATRPRSR